MFKINKTLFVFDLIFVTYIKSEASFLFYYIFKKLIFFHFSKSTAKSRNSWLYRCCGSDSEFNDIRRGWQTHCERIVRLIVIDKSRSDLTAALIVPAKSISAISYDSPSEQRNYRDYYRLHSDSFRQETEGREERNFAAWDCLTWSRQTRCSSSF